MNNISAIIITFNEENNIKRCIRSLIPIADEIVIVDSFSTDNTKKICKELGVRFVQHSFEGYGPQKQFASDLASFDWIISLDADEELSQELRNSILSEKEISNGSTYTSYSMNRRNFYCGKKIGFCGWYPDEKTRIFNKKKCKWNDNLVHESITNTNNNKHLKGDLYHYTYSSEEQHLQKAKRFAELASSELLKQGKCLPLFTIYVKTIFRFIKSYFFQLGFLDGYYGFKISQIGALFFYWKQTIARNDIQRSVRQKKV